MLGLKTFKFHWITIFLMIFSFFLAVLKHECPYTSNTYRVQSIWGLALIRNGQHFSRSPELKENVFIPFFFPLCILPVFGLCFFNVGLPLFLWKARVLTWWTIYIRNMLNCFILTPLLLYFLFLFFHLLKFCSWMQSHICEPETKLALW